MLSHGFFQVFKKLSQNCLKVVQSCFMSHGCLMAVPKLFQSCTKDVSKLYQICLKDVAKLSQSCTKVASKMSLSCLTVAPKLSPICFKVVPKLFIRCLKVVPKLWYFVWSFCLKNPIDMSEEVMRITFGHLPSGDENGSED